ncbi:MAG: acetyl-CoA carboxylase biotin carboxylase subunit [Candidatus Omnitrophica bacterium]|nr:acetyl-CoA carboxylase biotin carboxylase subunit [Candidatus Omnitrophota bacterium]
MFSKLLVANRGEVAVRIIRACRELGIRTVAVYSTVDAESLHVRMADEAVCIGPGASAQSYLNIPAIISAAEVTDVEAIHPGYGFLAENAHFAEICASCQIEFIGPSPEAIRLMGHKLQAKELMKKAGLPLIPGSPKAVTGKEEALKVAKQIKYPVIIKAAAGGGGKGMRVAHNDVRLVNALMTCQAEAAAAFGVPDVYIEKFVEEPRHVEIQILADRHGKVLALGERDCTVQRRHQKLLEEAPSPVVDGKLRQKMGQAAVRGAKMAGYTSAGTMEFLVDKHGDFYFMEMNTRLQVEHPVTEYITGVDLVKTQIRVAAGEKLAIAQDDVKPRGHSIECRINAEDPSNNFAPCPGVITRYHPAGGPNVRVDSHVYAGYRVPPTYDSMIAKLIVHGRTRREAIAIMSRALAEFTIEPIKTTIPFHQAVMGNPDFLSGNYSTNFVNQLLGLSPTE